MKNVSKLGTALTKTEQKEITGGFWGCQPQLLECSDNSDCPPCSFGCGIIFNGPNGPTTIDICAF
jgi:hypothetical protein